MNDFGVPMNNPPLPFGYSSVAPEQLAQVVTFLEMTARPARNAAAVGSADLRRFTADDVDAYRTLFRRVGEDWLWSSRLELPKAELSAILGDPRREAYALRNGGEGIGLLELDFREPAACELSFFGLAPQAIGHGFGRGLMNEAIARAWAKPIHRFWVHTCTLDHPTALGFYCRSGFRPYAQAVEVSNDPRLTGHLSRTAAPHIALMEKDG